MNTHQLPSPLKKGVTGFPWDKGSSMSPNPQLNYPKITIVTPSYNQAEFLEETIRSVLMQNYPNLEYIVLDGGSTDQSIKILKHYDEFITHWASEPDKGQADAINRGFAHSTGEIMGWLNSDDLLLPNALFHIAHTFMKNHRAQIVTGLRKMIDVDSRVMYNFFHGRPIPEHVRHICDIGQETVYWRRDLWRKVGPLDTSFHFALDYDYWQRCIHAGYQFTLIPRYLGALRVHDESKSSTLHEIADKDLQRIYQRYNIAQNYDEAETRYVQIDKTWSKRRRLLRDLRHHRISNNAQFLVCLDDILRTPILGSLILHVHNQYRRLRGRFHD